MQVLLAAEKYEEAAREGHRAHEIDRGRHEFRDFAQVGARAACTCAGIRTPLSQWSGSNECFFVPRTTLWCGDCGGWLQRADAALKQSKNKDYYKILGVPRNADDKAIKKAYR